MAGPMGTQNVLSVGSEYCIKRGVEWMGRYLLLLIPQHYT
jgi:hypothetical protein